MPSTFNMPGSGVQLGNDMVGSIVYRAYASVSDQSVEVPIQNASYLIGHFFSGKNGGGTDLGQVSIDYDVNLFTGSGKTDIVSFLQYVFPVPSGTN